MLLPDGEPAFGPWTSCTAAAVPGAAMVHTDDVAWHQAHERPFLAADHPGERADVVVSGAGRHDARHELVEVSRRVPDLPPLVRRLER